MLTCNHSAPNFFRIVFLFFASSTFLGSFAFPSYPSRPATTSVSVGALGLLLSMDQTNAAVAAAVPPPVPTAAPVVPVDLTVVKKRLGGGGDMAVHDSSGALAFRVTAADDGGRGRALLDASGSTLVTVRSSEDVWHAFRGIGSEQKDVIFSAKVMCASSKRKEVHVLLPPRSAFEDPKPNYMLVGNPFQRACTIIKGNSIVAQANLPYKLNKAVYSRRKFRVTIYPGNDNILIMAMIMTFLVQK